MSIHNTRYSCMEKPRVNQFCSQCYCMRLPWPQSWYPVLDEWTINELILGHCILHRDSVPRASRVQPEMFCETSTAAFSNLDSNWKLEFWMFLRSYSPRLVFMSFNPYCTTFCRVSEIINERSINAGWSNHKQQTFSKETYTPVQLSIFVTLNQNSTNLYCFNMILYITRAKTNMTMENPEFEDVFPIEHGDLPMSF